MIKTEFVTQSIGIDRHYCNICGQSCIKKHALFNQEEFATLEASWGYLSNKDGQKHVAHFCETCYNKIKIFIENTLKGSIEISNCF